ncbi:UDP-N-acetylmuramoyl-L-alanyl-D-glutamate--2,6-diaminopimelate ligase [candidate division LCP-89 bacterium B3_LCP]|uniref:UDP-N-acetylmuramoyl-L-alanyl-D-glutamate--2,6-diaminopimelate ligase n=1 Tax=candidate division LCP-89 bacterium B3_LCP TaxID=2012998 RepID=A0A532V2N1_UNCL8|nr:MAG: UDP-N-acetylmuramoyl-L-alanyl-D-glutamate--2,6-diaminopimelate ligase [candidate division LCP-89 bacterium B3_LCP]
MKLSEIAAGIPGSAIKGVSDPEIAKVDYDSRQVNAGSLFFALQGEREDGRKFIPQALERGAAAVALSAEPDSPLDVPYIIVSQPRQALALAAGIVTGYPDQHIDLVAVTGTNGKTTIISLVGEILKYETGKSGVIGTLGGVIGDRTHSLERTTPEAPDIYALLAEMYREGIHQAAMEVSSHALSLERVFGMKFSAAVFTNLSRDHLDFHETIDEYFNAKAKLFSDYKVGTAIINVDDQYGQKLVSLTDSDVLTFALESSADVHPTDLQVTGDGIFIKAGTPRGEVEFQSPLLGRFNAYNLLGALAVSEVLKTSHEAFVSAVKEFKGAPGRLEQIILKDRRVFIDYAHTPEALKLVLTEIKRISEGPLVVVFGCGGDRDQEKRPIMGRIAEENSDTVYITTDNPRTERPARIMSEILSGLQRPQDVMTILDRRHAISTALHKLPAGGTLLIAGKGHETYQEINGKRFPFDDRAEVIKYQRELVR